MRYVHVCRLCMYRYPLKSKYEYVCPRWQQCTENLRPNERIWDGMRNHFEPYPIPWSEVK
jgi:hypothetical protein